MPTFDWGQNPGEIVQQFEQRHSNPDAGALLLWAVWSVDCLYYLDDVDRVFDASRVPIAGHRPDIIDVSHARWATGTCITALDLCAAGLTRALGYTEKHEFDFEELNPATNKQISKKKKLILAKVPASILAWSSAVGSDPAYDEVKAARNCLTHSRIRRHFFLGTSGPPGRLSLSLPSGQIPVREVVETARDFATRHVKSFVNLLPST